MSDPTTPIAPTPAAGSTPFLPSPVGDSVASHPRCRPAKERLGQGDLSVEVVVIGTGAGGALAGTELAKRGKKVLFLEAGGAFERKDFQQRSLTWSTVHLYNQRGAQLSLGEPAILLPSGRAVGGSTVINSGICFRPPRDRLETWSRLTGRAHLAPDAMAPVVDEVWRRIGVFKTHAGIGRRHNLLFQAGVERLGFEGDWIDRNAPTCGGCGVCHLGCPSGAKASVDKAILPEALHLGAELLYRARAEGVIVEGGRATGVDVIALDDKDQALGALRVKADVVILSGSALGSPLILEHSGVGGDERGKHLSVHPGSAAVGDFDEPVTLWDGVPQGYWAHDPDDERIVLETVTLGVPELFGLFGRAGQEGIEELSRLKHLAIAGGMVRDHGEGSVSLSSGFTPSIRYDLGAPELASIKQALRSVTRIYFAAGARRVCPLVHPLRFFEREADAIAAIDGVTSALDLAHVHASHPQGTCRMGPRSGPDAGVVDGDGKVHGVSGLYVMDGSIVAGSVGVNPQVTIMSLALALSRRLAS